MPAQETPTGPNTARRAWRRLAAALLAVGIAVLPGTARIAHAVAVASDDAYTVDEDSTLVVDAATGLLANDTADVGEEICVLGIDASGLTGSVETHGSDGSFEYAPAADWNGVTSFTYVLGMAADASCNAAEGTVATVTITVDPVNDPPVAQSDTLQALPNRTLNVASPGVLGNDFDVDGDALSAVKESNPAHGTVTLAPDGAFSYTPAAGYVGPDGFSYRASDGSTTSPIRVVSITVTALPTSAPTSGPTPAPTPAPTPTAAPSPSASAEASASPDPFASASAAPSLAPSGSPGASVAPEDPAADEGGLPIPVIGLGLLLLALVAFGGAVFLPKWLAGRRSDEEPPLEY